MFACLTEVNTKLPKEIIPVYESIKPTFFGKHVLGIMTTFSDIIGNPMYSRGEMRRCLKAIKLMLSLGGNSVAVALPQVWQH